MKTLIRANELFQEIQSIDKEIKVLETDLKNVIGDDLSTELSYEIKNKPKKENILDEDGSIRNQTTISWIQSLSENMRDINTDEKCVTLNPSEFVVMFGALLNYKKKLRKKLVDDFKKLETKIKL